MVQVNDREHTVTCPHCLTTDAIPRRIQFRPDLRFEFLELWSLNHSECGISVMRGPRATTFASGRKPKGSHYFSANATWHSRQSEQLSQRMSELTALAPLPTAARQLPDENAGDTVNDVS